MRAELITFINNLTLTGFSVSNDLPYTSSGEELYKKNVKRIYVNEGQTVRENLIRLMSGCNVDSIIDTVQVIFATDAKQKPSNYETVVQSLVDVKEQFVNTYFTRECTVSTEFDSDIMITTLEYTFTKL